MLPYVPSVYQTFKLMAYEVTLVWRRHSSDEAVVKLMQPPENCMIRRSIKHKTHTRALTKMDFRVNITSTRLLVLEATNTHWLQWIMSSCSLSIISEHRVRLLKKKKKVKWEIMLYPPSLRKGQIYSHYFLFEPSDAIKIKWHWYGVFLCTF